MGHALFGTRMHGDRSRSGLRALPEHIWPVYDGPMLDRTIVLALLCVGLACGGAKTKEPKAPEIAPEEAVREAEAVITEIHAALRRGSPDGILPLLASDLFVVGPGATDFFEERGALVVALNQAIEQGKKHKVRARGLRVVAAPGGRSAWATEQLEVDGKPYTVTAILAEVEELWVVTTVHVARPVADRKVKQALEGGTLPRPGPLPRAATPNPAISALFTEAAKSRDVMGEQLADRKDVVLIGSAPKEITRGAKKIKKLWKKAMDKQPTFAPQGEVRTGTTPDGALAWVIANVDLGLADAAPVPHRGIYIYERAPDRAGNWALVAVHEAVVAPPK